MRYCEAVTLKEVEELSFKIYVTDSVQYLTKSLAQEAIEQRWVDIAYPPIIEDIDADEVALDIISRAGLVVKEE